MPKKRQKKPKQDVTFLADMAIDVSGTPREDNYFGLVSMNSYNRAKIADGFYKKFPELKHSRWKGTKLGSGPLLKIVEYFDKNKVHSYATRFLTKDWVRWRQNLQGEPIFNERIHAIMYFKLVKMACWRGLPKRQQIYNISLDEETNVNMDSLMETCQRLCKGGRINVSFNKTRAKYSEMIKFADYAAAAYKKVNEKKLKGAEYFKIASNEITYNELNKAFRLYKKAGLKKKFRNLK